MKQLLSVLLTFGMLIFPTGCYLDVGKDSTGSGSVSISTGVTGVTAGTSTVDETLVGKVLVRGAAGLMAVAVFGYALLFGFDAESAALIALAFFDAVTLSLLPAIDANDPIAVAPHLAEQAVRALARTDVKIPDGKTKEQALDAIITGLFKGLGDNAGLGLAAADQTKLLALFTGSATKGLVGAQTTDVGESAATIAGAMTAALDEAGMAPAQAAAQCQAMMTALVANLKDAGLTDAAAIETAASKSARAAVVGLKNGGVIDTAVVDASVEALSKGATLGLSDLGLSSDEQAQIAASIAASAAEGMADAGYDAAHIDSVKAGIQTSISDSLQTNGVTESAADAAAADAAQSIGQIAQRIGL